MAIHTICMLLLLMADRLPDIIRIVGTVAIKESGDSHNVYFIGQKCKNNQIAISHNKKITKMKQQTIKSQLLICLSKFAKMCVNKKLKILFIFS